MYGLVNRAVEDLVRTTHGDAAWERVKAQAGLEIDAFMAMEGYDDAITYDLVSAASVVLDQPVDRLLEAFGEHWTRYTAHVGYGAMFKQGGATFKEFMLNLHMLHTRVALSFPHLSPPSFWCTDVTDSSLRLHYQSRRPGLGPMVVGLVRGLGLMFDQQVDVESVRSRADGADHDEFLVSFPPQAAV